MQGEGKDGGRIQGSMKSNRINPLIKHRSRKLRLSMTDAEQKIWIALRQKQIGNYKFRRQHPYKGYILDFVCLESKLVIEIDGGQHVINVEYDKNRTHCLEKGGYKILRFWNNEVMSNLDSILEVIWRELDSDTLPPP